MERSKLFIKLREKDGLTFREISEKFKHSVTASRERYRKALLHVEKENIQLWNNALSARAMNALYNIYPNVASEIKSNEQFRFEITKGRMKGFWTKPIRNLGKKTIKEVADFLKLEFPHRPDSTCPHCGQKMKLFKK